MTMQLIGWAIIHSLWQGGIIAVIATGLLAASGRSSAAFRYGIAMTSLVAMLALPIATAILSNRPMESSTPLASPVSPRSLNNSGSGIEITGSYSSEPAKQVTSIPSRPIILSERTIRSIDAALPWLVAAWLVGLLLSSVRLMGGLARTRRITRRGATAGGDALRIRIERICARLGIQRVIRAVESIEIDVPLVIGAIRPVIVVPASLVTGLTPLQLDMLLAHELAHVRRHDYLVNLVQTVIETLLFYHPAARWITDRAREERENCCDDIALAICGCDAQQYTSTLLVLEEARGQGFGLAAAATGGSLLKRAQRLLTGQNASLELGPRWIAGVITIGAALFASRDAMAAVQSSFVAAPVTVSMDSSNRKHLKQDLSHGAPSSVVHAPASLSLQDKWKWAEQNVKGSSFWIGYLIGGDESGKHNLYLSDVPVGLDGATNMTGRLNFDDDISGLTFHGVPLAPLVGNHSRHSTAIFFEVKNGRVERAHINTFFLPGYFNGEPLAWLDSASDDASLALIDGLMARKPGNDLRVDMVSAIGSHRSARVVGILTQILESGDIDDVRNAAADYLGRVGDPRAMTVLARTARFDRSKDVRREAIESIGQMEAPSATDTLIGFANTFESSEIVEDVIEALGHRPDDRAFNYLVQTVNKGRSQDVRERAAESIADLPGQKGASTVIDLAQTHPDPDIRRQFVEALARLEPSSRALEILQRILIKDSDEDVRNEAVEAIGEVDNPQSLKIIADIARNDMSADTRIKALEVYADAAKHNDVRAMLKERAQSDPSQDVREKARELLQELAKNSKD